MKWISQDQLSVELYSNRAKMGAAAAKDAAQCLRSALDQQETVTVIFAAAPSQNEFLAALCNESNVDWKRVNALHMDEYIGLAADAPQGFGNFLKERIFSRLPFRSVEYLDGLAEDIDGECARYSRIIEDNRPDMVFMGIGENGHIAFNDPAVADFEDPEAVKEVLLDERCRMQQVHDGCFGAIGEVPRSALTLTIPTLMRCKKILCIVPAATKAVAVARTLYGPIATSCPASILRRHVDATLYLDAASASLLKEV
jgi:glucosamine-6-phosphate deaminase